jgi:hypothetical protein
MEADDDFVAPSTRADPLQQSAMEIQRIVRGFFTRASLETDAELESKREKLHARIAGRKEAEEKQAMLFAKSHRYAAQLTALVKSHEVCVLAVPCALARRAGCMVGGTPDVLLRLPAGRHESRQRSSGCCACASGVSNVECTGGGERRAGRDG